MDALDDIQFIKNPTRWPAWPYLPIKRKSATQMQGFWQMGTIYAASPTKVMLTDFYTLDPNAELLEYERVEDLVADGWQVD